MELATISIGGISLRATTEWQFFPTENFILARHDNQQGVLRINVASVEKKSIDAQILFRNAEQLISNGDVPAPFEVKEPLADNDSHLFGSASYQLAENTRELFTRAWFIQRDDHAAFGFYGCAWNAYQEAAAQREIQQCERMMMSVRFTK